nr:immunoglobulin heavy chain junction region [Macaca mulatta]MOW91555.1 immunoglobulin heavy chain junction region [Macaca mulatta]MOW93244.1 immunoglobulin heavy chain junction region [Macaca mulatta]
CAREANSGWSEIDYW